MTKLKMEHIFTGKQDTPIKLRKKDVESCQMEKDGRILNVNMTKSFYVKDN